MLKEQAIDRGNAKFFVEVYLSLNLYPHMH